MSSLKSWCKTKTEKVKNNRLTLVEGDPKKISDAIDEIAKAIPEHYTSPERVARVMRNLGKNGAAKLIEDKLPTSKNIRSGDLGEILGSLYVSEFTKYATGINRLRWKDHREMAMRGDDIIAVRPTHDGKAKFLKGEAKSNAFLSATTVSKARTALKSNNSRPSSHALSFLAERLHETGEHDLADLIDAALLKEGIRLRQVSHLMFTFSGNDPRTVLHDDLRSHKGRVTQLSVGLRVKQHQAFIKAVFEKVIANGSDD